MRLLIYQFINPKTNEIVEVSTLDKAKEIRKHDFPYEDFTIENIVLRDCTPTMQYLGKDENGYKKFHYETLAEATERAKRAH